MDVKNSGMKDGNEVVQLYIDDVISSMSRPAKEHKGFEKIVLERDRKKWKIKLKPEHLSFLDRNLKPVVEPVMFEVMVCSSSEEIRLKGEFGVRK